MAPDPARVDRDLGRGWLLHGRQLHRAACALALPGDGGLGLDAVMPISPKGARRRASDSLLTSDHSSGGDFTSRRCAWKRSIHQRFACPRPSPSRDRSAAVDTDAGLDAFDIKAERAQALPGSPSSPVLATPAAAFVVAAKVAGAGLAAFTAGVALGEAID